MKKVFLVAFGYFFPLAAFAARNEVYVFNWSEYIDPSVLKNSSEGDGDQGEILHL